MERPKVATLLRLLPPSVSDWVRRVRLERQVVRAKVEVERSADRGVVDPRVAQRLLEHLALLAHDLRSGDRG